MNLDNVNLNDEIILIKMVKKNWKIICTLPEKYQTENVCIAAVRKNGTALKYIKNPTENVCIEAVTHKGHAIRYIKNPTENVCIAAIRKRPKIFKFIYLRTPKIINLAVKLYAPNFLELNPEQQWNYVTYELPSKYKNHRVNPVEELYIEIVLEKPKFFYKTKFRSERFITAAVLGNFTLASELSHDEYKKYKKYYDKLINKINNDKTYDDILVDYIKREQIFIKCEEEVDKDIIASQYKDQKQKEEEELQNHLKKIVNKDGSYNFDYLDDSTSDDEDSYYVIKIPV